MDCVAPENYFRKLLENLHKNNSEITLNLQLLSKHFRDYNITQLEQSLSILFNSIDDLILSFATCNFFITLTELPPKYFLSNELFWKKVVGILLTTLQQLDENRSGKNNGLVHTCKLLYIPFHRFSKSQNKENKNLQQLFNIIFETYSTIIDLFAQKVFFNSFLIEKEIPDYCKTQLFDLILEILLYEGISNDSNGNLNQFNALVLNSISKVLTIVERSEKKNQVLIFKFLELGSWFSSVYGQNIEIAIYLLESLETCFSIMESIGKLLFNSFSPPAVVFIKAISILLTILFAAVSSTSIQKSQMEKICKILKKIVDSNQIGEDLLSKFMDLFGDQDDLLIATMNSMLSLFIELEHENNDKVKYLLSTVPVLHHLKEEFHPKKVFTSFLEILNFDHSVLLDFLISDETDFLPYFLCYLRFRVNINSNSQNQLIADDDEDEENERICLRSLRETISRLHNKKLFPYNAQPLLKRLLQFEQNKT